MKKLLQFYIFDEHTDYEKECIKLGMKPIAKSGGLVKAYSYGECEYVVLGRSECYSGWEHTIMKLPQLTYNQLYNLAINANIYDERVGAVGIMLKFHEDEFIDYLEKVINKTIPFDKQIKKLAKLISTEIKQRSDYVSGMEIILKLCHEIYNE